MLYDPAMLCDPAMWTLLYRFFYLRRRPGGGLGRKYARQSRVEVTLNPRHANSDPQNASKKRPCFLIDFWLPKWSQKPSKMEQKSIQNRELFQLRFCNVFCFVFSTCFDSFGTRPTHDPNGMYDTFVRFNLFRKVLKSIRNDIQK